MYKFNGRRWFFIFAFCSQNCMKNLVYNIQNNELLFLQVDNCKNTVVNARI